MLFMVISIEITINVCLLVYYHKPMSIEDLKELNDNFVRLIYCTPQSDIDEPT